MWMEVVLEPLFLTFLNCFVSSECYAPLNEFDFVGFRFVDELNLFVRGFGLEYCCRKNLALSRMRGMRSALFLRG
jgi:hypothetical protein